MFSLSHFPKSLKVWHHATPVGTFWLIEAPDRRFLWGMGSTTLGIEPAAPLVIAAIRQQRTGLPIWDRMSTPQPVPMIEQWACRNGEGAYSPPVASKPHPAPAPHSRTFDALRPSSTATATPQRSGLSGVSGVRSA